VLTGNSSREHLIAHADAVLASIRDLPDWLVTAAGQAGSASGQ
jgi:hypothetical protein